MDKEYIEQLIKAHTENFECVKCFHFPVCSRLMGGMDLSKCEDFIPAADVEPVRHGEWIPIVNYFHGKPDGRYYCSVCHRVETVKGIYCRICGARMDGGKE